MMRAPTTGLLVPLDSVPAEAVGVSTRDSNYTQAGVRAGVATAHDYAWSPIVTGAQTLGVDVIALRGGYPGRGDGASFAARLATDAAATDWRGWAEPNLVVGWSAPPNYQAFDWEEFAGAVNPLTGVLVITGQYGSVAARTWTYDPRTETWATVNTWSTRDLENPIMMAADPYTPGRILMWSGFGPPQLTLCVAYYTDDDGTTWSIYAVGWAEEEVTAVISTGRGAVGVSTVREWLMLRGTQQLYSSDRGVTWRDVGSTIGVSDNNTWSIATTPRGYVAVYCDETTQYPTACLISTGSVPLEQGTEVVLLSEACEDVLIAADDDGILYAWCYLTATAGQVTCLRSTDGGLTWRDYLRRLYGVRAVAMTGYAEHDLALWSRGTAHLIGSHAGTPTNGVHLLQCGGWSTVDQGGGGVRDYRMAWVASLVPSSVQDDGVCYLPYHVPASMGWTTTGVGTVSTSPSSGSGLSISCTTGQSSLHRRQLFNGDSTTGYEYLCGAARLQVHTGGVATAQTDAYIIAVLRSGGTGMACRIYVGTDGIDVDDGASSIGSLAVTGLVDVRWFIRDAAGTGRVTVWARPVDGRSTWTRLCDDVAGGTVVTTDCFVQWGCLGAGGTTSLVTWGLVACGLAQDWVHELDTADQLPTLPSDGVRGLTVGRPLPSGGLRTSLPLAAPTGEQAYLSAVGGPVYTREQHEILAGYDWPITRLHPDVSPSPRAPWRSTTTVEQYVVYDAELATWRGGALALAALRASFRTAALEVDDGSTGWTVIGTLDKGWSIGYTLSGSQMVPGGATQIPRYLAEDELVGGYAVVGAVARRILRNSAGYWSATGAQQVSITLDGITGAETGTGNGEIVAPSGVLIAYPAALPARRYVRLRIPGSQVVPPDRGTNGTTAAYDAGLLVACRVVGAGSEAEWTPTRTVAYATTTSRRADGSPSVQQRGPTRRGVSYAWGELDLRVLRQSSSGVDTVGGQGGLPIGLAEDPWSSVVETIGSALRGGERPCLWVSRLPPATATITDPTLWLYGVVTTSTVTLSQAGGTEGLDERIRVSGLTVEEVP